MNRFYTPDLDPREPLSDDLVVLDADQARHAQTVLRLRVGDQVEVFDGCGRVGIAHVERWVTNDPQPALLRVASVRSVPRPVPTIDVACAMPKGPRGTAMAAALSQVGADRLIPLRCERAAVDPDRINRRRFEKTAIESARQCGRAYLLKVDPPAAIDELIRRPYGVRLFGMPVAGVDVKSDDLTSRLRRAAKMLILIGPEGGWTNDEQAAAVSARCTRWCFGTHVMRIETASAAAVTIVRYLTLKS